MYKKSTTMVRLRRTRTTPSRQVQLHLMLSSGEQAMLTEVAIREQKTISAVVRELIAARYSEASAAR